MEINYFLTLFSIFTKSSEALVYGRSIHKKKYYILTIFPFKIRSLHIRTSHQHFSFKIRTTLKAHAKKKLLTKTSQRFEQRRVWPPGKVLGLERLADDLVVADYHGQLGAQFGAEQRPILLGQLHVLGVLFAANEREVPEHRQTPRPRWQTLDLTH